MATRRTHIVEGESRVGIVTALCGRRLAQRSEVMFALLSMTVDEYLDAMREVVVPDSPLDCNWITVAQFVEEGDDSPDCVPCRRRLDAALVRYWGGDEGRPERESGR